MLSPQLPCARGVQRRLNLLIKHPAQHMVLIIKMVVKGVPAHVARAGNDFHGNGVEIPLAHQLPRSLQNERFGCVGKGQGLLLLCAVSAGGFEQSWFSVRLLRKPPFVNVAFPKGYAL